MKTALFHTKISNQSNRNAVTNKICDTLKKYSENSSIHGIRYIPQPNRHLLERIWWIMSIMLSIYLCASTISILNEKWQEFPVIVSYDAKLESIGSIPLPAMTICPANRIRSKKLNFTDVYRSLFQMDGNRSRDITNEELQKMKVAAQICNELFSLSILEKFPENESDYSMIDVIQDISIGFEESLASCYFINKRSSCHKYFDNLLTVEGLCYTFNLLTPNEIARGFFKISKNRNPKYWHIKTGYEFKNGRHDVDEFPFRTFRTGVRSGFSVLLKIANENVDELCSAALQGFIVTFHNPYEWPYLTKVQYYVEPNRSVEFSVIPKVIKPSKGLQIYEPAKRQCFFPSERRLKFFNIYTQANCRLECVWNLTLLECQCATFSMPQDDAMKLCGPSKVTCSTNAYRVANNRKNTELCNCLPACNSVTYDVSMLDGAYKLSEVFRNYRPNESKMFENATFSRIRVSFKDDHFRPVNRIELHTTSDFLANCGGLFGLFIGASLLSFIEIIYYSTFQYFSKFIANKEKLQCNPLRPKQTFPLPYTP